MRKVEKLSFSVKSKYREGVGEDGKSKIHARAWKMVKSKMTMNGWMDGRMDGRMDGWMDGWMDGQMNERTNERATINELMHVHGKMTMMMNE